MLKENVQKLLEDLRKDKDLFAKIRSADGPEEAEKVIREAGHDVSGADLAEAVEETSKEIAARTEATVMNVDGLEAVAGGQEAKSLMHCHEYWYWGDKNPEQGEKLAKNPFHCNEWWYWT